MRSRMRLLTVVILCMGTMGRSILAQDAKSVACASNAKQLATAFLMYSQDYDGTFPPTDTMEKFAKAISPYARRRKGLFACPVDGKPYALNTTLSGKKLKSIKSPGSTVMLYDSEAHPDGLFTVAYLDGHVRRENKVPILKEKSARAKSGK